MCIHDNNTTMNTPTKYTDVNEAFQQHDIRFGKINHNSTLWIDIGGGDQ